MLTDLVINPFGAHLADMLAVAKAADGADVGAVWVTDHFSGNVVDAPWSRDPFVCLGAIAAMTEHVDLGVLVANVTNRHAVQLASGINSLQSLAPGRVRLGVGSGAAPDSRFSVEHDMVDKDLGDLATRQAMLRNTTALLGEGVLLGKDPWEVGDYVNGALHEGCAATQPFSPSRT